MLLLYSFNELPWLIQRFYIFLLFQNAWRLLALLYVLSLLITVRFGHPLIVCILHHWCHLEVLLVVDEIVVLLAW